MENNNGLLYNSVRASVTIQNVGIMYGSMEGSPRSCVFTYSGENCLNTREYGQDIKINHTHLRK